MKKRKIALIMAVTALMLCTLTACSCKHEWSEATCETPKTCNLCEETEGEPLGHQWMEGAKLCTACGLDERSTDEKFLDHLAKGLDARWALTNADENKEVLTKTDWERYFDAEYNEIIEFEYATFDDPNLGKWAGVYIDSIVRSKEALPYFGTNQWDTKYHSDIYNDRVHAIYEIYAISTIPVSAENEATLIGMVSDGEVIDMTNDLFNKVHFDLVEREYGSATYEAVVENTTSVDFSYFSFDIDLIDEDGVTVGTESAYVENWNPGEKIRFSFWTSEEFAEMEVNRASWNY